VTKATSQAFPRVPITSVTVSFPASTANQAAFMTFVASNTPLYTKQGWGGHITPGTGLTLSNTLFTPAQAAVTFDSLRQFVATIQGKFAIVSSADYLDFFNNLVVPAGVPVGLPFTTATRLIPEATFEDTTQRTKLVDSINSATAAGGLVLILVNTPFRHGNTGGTSVTPAWYSAAWHVTVSGTWSFNATLQQKEAVYASLTKSVNVMRALTPNSGAYQNEADVFEPNHEVSFWGSNYSKLVSIKNKYDPDHILDCWHCVGFLGTTNSRYKCYPPAPAV